ncbi:Phosphoribosylamine--glycine ligase [Candidatus Magnetaquicoccaceae bacterium FCR-1]|uniref:Phosphoribosylamine--glycine ligase n=2 Tax=Candidatus Magnetaquiglobus chichijimensis TaxID=3141448 RepID=A0ABQ0CD69_9PROT
MGMKVLLVGGGGREHALAWKIAQSPLVEKLWCAPGNPGIALHAECVPIQAEAIDTLTAFAVEKAIDLAVIGPEAPLTLGLSDRLRERGIAVFGPSMAAARLEGSKAFMKDLLDRHAIATAAYRTFRDPAEAHAYVTAQGAPIVVKTSGLAAGKGAIVCSTLEEAHAAIDRIMVEREFGSAGDEVVVEGFLKGEEASLLAFVDGERVLPLAGAQDHKAIFDGDLGPNTGGMGAYSPAPCLTPALVRRAVEEIILPTVRGMAAEGYPYRGILYAGLMIDGDDLRILEYNVRFGDPECQPLLMRMRSDIIPYLLACASGSLEGMSIDWDPRAALCVVMAAQGYPGAYPKGDAIAGLDRAAEVTDTMVFHAGTRGLEGRIVTAGGRVLGVTALGDGVAAAQQRAYEAVTRIDWSGVQYRRDIGYRAVARERS